MKESDVQAFSTFARSFVDELETSSSAFVKNYLQAFNAECYVVYTAFRVFLQPFSDSAFFRSWFKKFNFSLTAFEECCTYFFFYYLFDAVAFCTKELFVIRDYVFEFVNCDTKVFNVSWFHNVLE